MSLPTRRLGTTDMEITRLGFGAWAIGGGDWAFGWGPQDDQDSVAAILHAVERGVNWIDTAAAYGLGHSEDLVGRAIKSLPQADRPLVFTKCGLVTRGDDRMAGPVRTGEADSIRAEVDASLRRLGVDRIDLMQVHWPAEDAEVEEYWGALVELRQAGKLRAIGLSNHGVAQLERAAAVGRVDTLQPPFSLIRREAAAELLPWCAAHEVGAIVYSPMQAGLLTGAFSPERVESLDEHDWRRNNPEFTTHLDRNLALVERLRAVAERLGVGPGAVALGWVLAHPAVTGAIVGARRPEQVDGWLPAATLQLDAATLAEIADAVRDTGAGGGPVG